MILSNSFAPDWRDPFLFEATTDIFVLRGSGDDETHDGHRGHAPPLPDDPAFADPSGNPICGTREGDVIDGTERRDVIDAKEGSDTIYAKGGDDTVFGRRGNDTIYGGDGNDRLSGGPGKDVIYAGGDGYENIVNGGAGADDLYGAEYVNVRDIFQFTLAKETAPDAYDTVYGFRTGEDKIHLAFPANDFNPAITDFELVDEDDAGTAGTMWIQDDWYQNSVGQDQQTWWIYHFFLHGHTDNDGDIDFSIRFERNWNDNDADWGIETLAEDMLKQSDFIFG